MKVQVSISSTSAILFALILCQFAKALQHVNLAMCDKTADSFPYCIVHDSMGEKHYLHENATLSLLIKLPAPVLTELWLDYSKIEIVNPSGDILNNGQEIISSQDRDRWTIKFNFERVDSDFGKLHLILHIKDVEYRDTQLLHLEIKSMITIFETTDKIWIPVEEISNGMENDHEGATNTTVNPVECETIQNDTEALQQKLTTTKNDLSRYQMKYFHCLESKEALNDTVKTEFKHGKGKQVLDIITLLMLLASICTIAYVVFMLRGSKLKTTEYNGMENDGLILQHSAVTFKDGKSFADLLSTREDV